MNSPDPMHEPRSDFLRVIANSADKDFTKAASFAELPGEVIFESRRWMSEIFSEGSGPNDQPVEPVRLFRLAIPGKVDFDILQHRYAVRGIHLQIFESAIMVYVRITDFPHYLPNETNRVKKIELLSAMLFKSAVPLHFSKIDSDTKNSLYSTSPQKTFTEMHNWPDRVDCSLQENEAGFIIYKISVDIPMMPDPQAWFPREIKK
jgi:hypothetical protein